MNFYVDLNPEIKIKDAYSVKDELIRFRDEYPLAEIFDINAIIVPLRMIKSKYEVSQIKEAIHLTKKGLEEVFEKIEVGLYEYQLKAMFEYTVKSNANVLLAFPSIVATSGNATILHYHEAHSKVENEDLVLFDVGSRSNNVYCGDISRTVPANGKFNPLQKSIYETVLSCNKYIISLVKPGKTLNELNLDAQQYLKTECVKKGLLKENEDIRRVFPHGVSHHLGLDTHDMAGKYINKNSPLVAGNVITVEPGLYFEEHKIGVRIEDDILVTERSCENLSRDIPKEIIDIEK